MNVRVKKKRTIVIKKEYIRVFLFGLVFIVKNKATLEEKRWRITETKT